MKQIKLTVYLFIIGVILANIYTIEIANAQNKISDGQVRESYAKSADVYTKAEVNATVENAIAAIPAGGGTAVEDEGTYIGSNTTWEFDADYDTTAVCIYRNRIYQPRSLFTTVDVSSKTRVVFTSAINASDEIILISNK